MKDLNFFSDKSDVENKTVLVRLDLNVPLKKKEIQEIILFLPESNNVHEIGKNFKKLVALNCLSYREINVKTGMYSVKDC